MLVCMDSLPHSSVDITDLTSKFILSQEVNILGNLSRIDILYLNLFWIFFLLNVICRVDDYIYDGNKDDLDASNDADFSLKPCSKSKKKSSKKVQI